MVQTVCTHLILSGEKKIVIEKPLSLHRIFFFLGAIVSASSGYDLRVSFDDPHFLSFYSLQGARKYIEAKGEDIFQGNIWVQNNTSNDLLFTATEILR